MEWRLQELMLLWICACCCVIDFGAFAQDALASASSSAGGPVAALSTDLQLDPEEEVIALWMPFINVTSEDEYHCLGHNIDFDQRYITKYIPHASEKSVHHILIYGCSVPIQKTTANGAWKCRDDHPVQAACTGRSKLLFAWAKDAPAFQLPKDVGFQLGHKSDVQGLFIQIHYNAIVHNDNSGISVIYTSEPKKYQAGIWLMAGGGQFIPPLTPAVNVNVMCDYNDDLVIHPFGFRTHAHSLGVVISGWYVKPEDKGQMKWTFLGKQSPQNPQSFYPMKAAHNITKGSILGARCVYNSTERPTPTFMGPTHLDEMCNFYMMYYADRPSSRGGCTDVEPALQNLQLPVEASIPLPPSEIFHHHNHHAKPAPAATGDQPAAPSETEHVHEHPSMAGTGTASSRKKPDPAEPAEHGREGETGGNELPVEEQGQGGMVMQPEGDHEEHGEGMPPHNHGGGAVAPHTVMGQPVDTGFQEDDAWSSTISGLNLGQISGITVDPAEDNVYIFARRDHAWDASAFDFTYKYNKAKDGPISTPTIFVVDRETGKVNKQFGESLFYMPHGITVDHSGNVWVADVALHQVIRLTNGKPSLVLGKQFEPGHDGTHFCQPTSIAVQRSGDFFVADGYCNARIIHFTKDGQYKGHIGQDQWTPFPRINPGPEDFHIPHDIKLSADEKILYVADRENGRVVVFDVENGKFQRVIKLPEFGERVFALDITDDLLVAVNGPGGATAGHPVHAVLVNLTTGNLVGTVMSKSSPLASPHAVTISKAHDLYIVELNGKAHRFYHPGVTSSHQKSAQPEKMSGHSHGHTHGHDESQPHSHEIQNGPEAPGFSLIAVALITVPTLIVLGGAALCCIRQMRSSSSQSKWKNLLYQYKENVKNPVDLRSYRARKEGFRPLNEAVDGSSDSEDEAFSARKYQRNALA